MRVTATKNYYAEQILKIINEAEADGFHVSADWCYILVSDELGSWDGPRLEYSHLTESTGVWEKAQNRG